MNDTARDAIILYARSAIIAALADRDAPPAPPYLAAEVPQHEGVFVTLYVRDELRGCMGNLDSTVPFITGLTRAATSAATVDSRFPRVRKEEFPFLHVEINILTDLHPLHDPDDIRIGAHGLIIEQGRHRGLLLPSVAVAQALDSGQFLEAVCRKAGLAAEAWKAPESRLSCFRTICFRS